MRGAQAEPAINELIMRQEEGRDRPGFRPRRDRPGFRPHDRLG